MNQKIIFQRAELSDFLQIAELDRVGWKDHQYRSADTVSDGEHAWRHWVEDALVFCAKSDSKVIGFALAFLGIKPIFCLHKILVMPAYTGQGIGSKLMQMVLQEIDLRHFACFLTVGPVNEKAIRLYEKLGFVERRFIKGYYRSHEDRFVLTRPARI
jgi:[ribosomal protein S18]-alanine N-acetyltransferase